MVRTAQMALAAPAWVAAKVSSPAAWADRAADLAADLVVPVDPAAVALELTALAPSAVVAALAVAVASRTARIDARTAIPAASIAWRLVAT
jgi:hypothetical protein